MSPDSSWPVPSVTYPPPTPQAQHDYLQGHYPVVREDAAQMCALQVQAEHASTLMEDAEGMMQCIEKYVTKQVRGWRDWRGGVRRLVGGVK